MFPLFEGIEHKIGRVMCKIINILISVIAPQILLVESVRTKYYALVEYARLICAYAPIYMSNMSIQIICHTILLSHPDFLQEN